MLKGLVAAAVSLAALGAAADVSARKAQASSVLAVRCAARAFEISYDPRGSLKILEYTYPKRDKTPGAVPTGRVLGYMDPSTRQIAPFCSRIKSRPLPSATRTRALAGPFPRGSLESRVFCMKALATWDGNFARTVDIEMRPVVNRARRPIGTRLIVRIDSILALTATVTRRDGTYAFDFSRCVRNPSF